MNRRYPLVALIGTQALDSYNISYNNLGKPLQVGEAALARQGRIGLVFFLLDCAASLLGTSFTFQKSNQRKKKIWIRSAFTWRKNTKHGSPLCGAAAISCSAAIHSQHYSFCSSNTP